MPTVRMPSSVAARKTRIAISPRLATRSFFMGGEFSKFQRSALTPSPLVGEGWGEGCLPNIPESDCAASAARDSSEPPLTPALSHKGRGGALILLLLLLCALPAAAQLAEQQPRFELTRMAAHWTDYATPEYLQFIQDAKVEVAQVGFYGAHYWSLAHTKEGAGYPAHFPVQGLAENAAFLPQLNQAL